MTKASAMPTHIRGNSQNTLWVERKSIVIRWKSETYQIDPLNNARLLDHLLHATQELHSFA